MCLLRINMKDPKILRSRLTENSKMCNENISPVPSTRHKFAAIFTYLANDEEILPLNGATVDLVLNAGANFSLVSINKSAIDVAVSAVDGCLHRFLNLTRLRLQIKTKQSFTYC